MRHLDRSRDHAEIHGNGKKLLAQDGQVFLPDGSPAGEKELGPEGAVGEVNIGTTPETREPAPLATEGVEPITSDTPQVSEQPSEVPLTVSGEPAKVAPDDMRLAANRALKTQMEAFGEPWQGVEHARKFLGVA